jgi:hypothetical protein
MSKEPKRLDDPKRDGSHIIYSIIGLAVVGMGATVIYFLIDYMMAQGIFVVFGFRS